MNARKCFLLWREHGEEDQEGLRAAEKGERRRKARKEQKDDEEEQREIALAPKVVQVETTERRAIVTRIP